MARFLRCYYGVPARLFGAVVWPLQEQIRPPEISLYKNSDLSYERLIPAQERGERTSSRARVGWRWTRTASARMLRGRAGQWIEPSLVSPAQAVSYERCRLRTAKSRGPGCRCYSQALWRCGAPDRADRVSQSVGRRWQTGIRHRGERGISRKATAQGRPGCFRLHLCFLCALRVRFFAQGSWVPAGARSSLRPFQKGRDEDEQNSDE